MTAPYRLPPAVRPRHYDIHLDVDVERPTFTGTVRIEADVVAPTDVVELHARDLDVTDATVAQGGHEAKPTVSADPGREMMALRLPRRLEKGRAVLTLAFEGKVSANMEGLYLSKDGAEKCLATQCEETDARAIFPCFDEPAFKARFAWKVTARPDMTVLANGPLVGVEEKGGRKTWTFAPTKPMSSYLVALAIGPLASTREARVMGVPMRVWAMRGKEHFGEYGLDFAARLLPWYTEYFGVPYHFDKYDQVAVPSFSAGAMENSGLVIFRSSLLLLDPKTTSWAQEKFIALVIAHEFAHMWFGNLVTMDWWDDIWLNESFAEWMAHKAVEAIAPEYRLWDDFHQNKRDAMVTDALASSHAIYSPVETPEQATELFDAITYNKGSALMRMIEAFVGEDAFRAALRTYMKEFAERNARGGDLWRHMEQASRQPMTTLLESWILQAGHPVVSAWLDGDRLHLAQRRFFSTPGAPDAGQRWHVPLVIRYRDDAGVHEVRHLLTEARGEVRLPTRGSLRWVHANGHGVGFYRQHLDAPLRRMLVAHAKDLVSAEQMDLLDDSWALVRSGDLPMGEFLDVVGPLVRHAANHTVLAVAVDQLDDVEDLLEEAGDPQALARFRAWVRDLFADEARRLGFVPRDAEPRDDRERRASVLRALAKLAHDPEALRVARELADREADAPDMVDPTLAGLAVGLAARGGDAGRLARHLEVYERRRSSGAPPSQVQRYLYSFALFPARRDLDQVLGWMRDGRFPLEAKGPLLRLMLAERHARSAAWDHLRAEWPTIRATLGDMWTGFLVEHTGHLPPSRKAEITRFFDANLHGVAQQAYARALEALDQRAEFEARTRADLLEWFDGRD